MHPQIDVLLDPIVEAVWFPGIREKHQRHRLSKVVELEPACSYCVHDRGVVDDAHWDFESSSSEDYIGVGRSSMGTMSDLDSNESLDYEPERIANDE